MSIFKSCPVYISQAIKPERRPTGSLQDSYIIRPGPHIHFLDSFSGYTNGRAYGSMQLLHYIRSKGIANPEGPTDLYK